MDIWKVFLLAFSMYVDNFSFFFFNPSDLEKEALGFPTTDFHAMLAAIVKIVHLHIM